MLNPIDMHIEIAYEEALVLFEWLASNSDKDSFKVRDQVDRVVLWKIEGILEKVLPVFDPNYKKLVEVAREKIAAQHDI